MAAERVDVVSVPVFRGEKWGESVNLKTTPEVIDLGQNMAKEVGFRIDFYLAPTL